MTTFTIKTANGFNTNNALPLNQSQIILQNKTNWVAQDSITGDKYIFLGSNFTYDSNGLITGGLITKVSQLDKTGKVIATAQFSQAYDVTKLGYPHNYSDLLLGDDSIIGGIENDTLNGGNGSSTNANDVYNYNGHSYLLSNAGTWTQAEAQAVSLGGHLVTVNDKAEQDWLVSTFLGTDLLWIGLTDQKTEGTFEWISGEALTYTNWDGIPPYTEPNNGGGNEDYVHLWAKNWAINGVRVYGTWNDLPVPNYWPEQEYSAMKGIIELNNINSGNDTFKGGLGNDTYYVDSAGDTVVESANQGNDTVNSSLPFYKLTGNVENLTLTGTEKLKGFGNNLDNVITGNSAANMLAGYDGNDFLNGGAGDDALFGGNNIDTAVYSGVASDYKIEFLKDNLKITDLNLNNGDEGVDTLTGIESLQFNGTTYTAGIDLVVSSITPANLTVEKGDVFSFDYVVENKGTKNAVSTTSGIYLDGQDNSNKLSGWDGWDKISAIKANGTDSDSNSFDTTNLLVGEHTLWIKADATGIVTEQNEDNNWISLDFTVTPPTKQTYSSNAVFSAKDASLYGDATGANYTKTFDNFVAKFADIHQAGNVGFNIDLPYDFDAGLNLNYNVNVSDIQVGVPINFALTAGVFDFSYPLNAAVTMPLNINKGAAFTISTASRVSDTPTMNVTGPNASLKVETLVQAKVDADASMSWGVSKWSGTDKLFSIHDTLSAPSITLFELSPDNLDPAKSLVLNQNLNLTSSTQGGSSVYRNPFFELSTSFDSNGLEGSGVPVAGSDGLYDISTELQQTDSMANLRFDIDDTAGFLLANPVISKLDSQYRNNHQWLTDHLAGDWKTDLTYSLFSADANLGVSPEMKVDFDAKNILVTLTPSWDTAHPKTKALGQSFDLIAPTNATDATVDVFYTLDGTVTTKAGISIDGSIGLKFMGVDGKVLGYDMPALFPDGSDANSDKENFLSDSLGNFSWPENTEINSFDFDIASFDVSYESEPITYPVDLWLS